jgi:hypothetical protein
MTMKWMGCLIFVAAAMLAGPVAAQSQGAQSQPADNMEILRDKLKADKKLVVAANMDLTEAEAKGFWPVYDAYQKELGKINGRLGAAVAAYAKEYNANTLTDEKAKKLIDEAIAIEEAEVQLKRGFVPRLAKVLPGRKVARYIQIENKIRAIVKYEIAAEVPLAP